MSLVVIRLYLRIKHAFFNGEPQVQLVLSIVLSASKHLILKKIASFVVEQCIQRTTAACEQVVVVGALVLCNRVIQDGPNVGFAQGILSCRHENAVTLVVQRYFRRKIGSVRHHSDYGISLSQRHKLAHQFLPVVRVPVSGAEPLVEGIILSVNSARLCSAWAGRMGTWGAALVQISVVQIDDIADISWTLHPASV